MGREKRRHVVLAALVTLVVAALTAAALASAATQTASSPSLVYGGLSSGSGSTIGPDGALYVTDPVAGRIVRIAGGTANVYADCLPPQLAAVGLGGAMDVAFIGSTAYALVTIVDGQFGGTDTVGIYRVDSAHSCTPVADIGAYTRTHVPTAFPVFVQSGVQYAMEPYRGGFLVTDGHHNKVLRVGLDGSVSAFRTFDDIVPTGLARHGDTVYMAEAGPVPHLPQNGKIVSFDGPSSPVTEVASGGRLLVDVEEGRGRTLFALAQGMFTPGNPPGSPAEPNTGQLLRVDDGGFDVVASGLNRPTSLEIVGNTAYVVTLGGQVWKVDGIAGPPYGAH
jgi:hypothetical protein